MKTLKILLVLLLCLALLCGCVPSDVASDEAIGDDASILPDYDTDEDDGEAVPPIDFEDDGGAILDIPDTRNQQIVEKKNDEFMLTLWNASDKYTSDENIEIEATVSLISGEELTVWSGDPILTFSLEGDTCFNDGQGGAITMSILMANTFTNVEDMIVPYSKAGGYSADDPNYEFYKSFFADQDSFKLPAGNYKVTACLDYSMSSDDVVGTRRNLSAEVEFTVTGKTMEEMDYSDNTAYEEALTDEPEIEAAPEIEVEPQVSDDFELTLDPLVNVTYPEMGQYPGGDMELMSDWEEYEKLMDAWYLGRAVQQSFEGKSDKVNDFVTESVREILLNNDSKNIVYSPINLYMALGMLAELADNESRQQILDALGEDSIEDLRKSVKGLWNNNYCDDGALTSIMGGSVWADEGVEILPAVADILASDYYSEMYSCDVGSPEMIEAYKAWLNKQTGGLLKDAIENTEIDEQTLLVLATTVYFRAKWDTEFQKETVTTEKFNLLDGTQVDCEFMHQSGSGMYFYADKFGAVNKRFNDGGSMWFILPDEGVTIEELITDSKALELMTGNTQSVDSAHVVINMSVPKFDVSSDIKIKENLKNLGITDVFNSEKADFSNLTASVNGDVFLDSVKHVARVAIDEEGVTAAAYTEMLLCGDALPPNEVVDFILDRPFLFAITGYTDDVMFVGVVNNPN